MIHPAVLWALPVLLLVALVVALVAWRSPSVPRPSPKVRPPKDGLGSRPWKSGGL